MSGNESKKVNTLNKFKYQETAKLAVSGVRYSFASPSASIQRQKKKDDKV